VPIVLLGDRSIEPPGIHVENATVSPVKSSGADTCLRSSVNVNDLGPARDRGLAAAVFAALTAFVSGSPRDAIA
jgi:hypothetical protein